MFNKEHFADRCKLNVDWIIKLQLLLEIEQISNSFRSCKSHDVTEGESAPETQNSNIIVLNKKLKLQVIWKNYGKACSPIIITARRSGNLQTCHMNIMQNTIDKLQIRSTNRELLI